MGGRPYFWLYRCRVSSYTKDRSSAFSNFLRKWSCGMRSSMVTIWILSCILAILSCFFYYTIRNSLCIFCQQLQNEHTYKPERTAERIARENNLSDSYVRRAEHFAKGVDAAEEAVPGIKQEILTGSIKPTEKAVAAIAKAPPEERLALVQQLRQAKEIEKPKPKRSAAETLQAIRDISENMLQSNGEIDADDICAELEDALDTMIFRWDTCLENNREQRSACRDGIRSLTEKGIQYLQKMRRTT